MAPMVIVVAAALLVVFAGCSSNAAVVEHTFVVSQVTVRHLCEDTLVTVVNGQLPGPAIEVTTGDSVVVHVVNQSPYGITIHWHGVKQLLNNWADGAGMVTQCPIAPNASFTYRFDVAGQEGTLWWHSHVSTPLRATIHGAIIIRPRPNSGGSYPSWFPAQPDEEVPIVIADFWQVDDFRKLEDALTFHAGKAVEQAIGAVGPTINGRLGDLYRCNASAGGAVEESFVLEVQPGKTYLLRLVNAALYFECYFKVAGHRLTVVAADANYVRPYTAADGVVAVAPGETLDVLMVADADAPPGQSSYHMDVLFTQPPLPCPQDPERRGRGIVRYTNDTSMQSQQAAAEEPVMPEQHDDTTSFYFYGNLTGRPDHPLLPQVRGPVQEHLFVTLGTGVTHLGRKVANMNNVSFQPLLADPEEGRLSLLESRYHGVALATEDLPARPPVEFDFTDLTLIDFANRTERLIQLEPTRKATTTRRFAYNSTVEVVFQSTTVKESNSNPIHIHGHDFFLIGQGLGNYDADRDVAAYNLVDPPAKNTVRVPALGWLAVRFVADNPGAWFMHCHIEFHMIMGMGTIIEVANGPTPDTALPPPPADLPTCGRSSSFAY